MCSPAPCDRRNTCSRRRCACCLTTVYRTRDNNQEIAIIGPHRTKLNIYPSSGARALGLGANEHLLIADEPASWKLRDGDLLWSALETSLGKLDDQRILVCGTLTPAEPGSWWPQMIDAGGDHRTYVQLHQADEDDPWDDLRVARKANPLLRVRPTLRAAVRAERDKGRRDPHKQSWYEGFRLNLHVAAAENVLLTAAELKRFMSREAPPRSGRCVLGLDVGASRSWSAVWLSWPNGRQECLAVTPGIPSLREQERAIGLPRGELDRLVNAGVLVVDHGREMARIETLLDALPRDARVSHVVADRFRDLALADLVRGRWRVEWRVNQWSTATDDIGVFRSEVIDGAAAVADHCRRLALISFRDARVERDTSGNVKMRKAHRRNRDDVAQAGVLAMSAATRMPAPRKVRLHVA